MTGAAHLTLFIEKTNPKHICLKEKQFTSVWLT